MIEKVSDNSGVSPAADLTQKAASSKTLRHTPFGDVMVDELSTPNLTAIFSGGRPEARRALSTVQTPLAAQTATAAATAGTASQTATAAATGEAGSVTSTIKAAVAASTEQTAAAAATAPAAADDATPDPRSIPTAESVFGSQPWETAPTGSNPDGSLFGYNPWYFATPQTAEQVATMMGGQVVEENAIAPNGPIHQNTANEMVKLPNGALVNAGIIASFYAHGYPQSYIDQQIHDVVTEEEATPGV